LLRWTLRVDQRHRCGVLGAPEGIPVGAVHRQLGDVVVTDVGAQHLARRRVSALRFLGFIELHDEPVGSGRIATAAPSRTRTPVEAQGDALHDA
jgi:hypothetical protein